MGPLAMDHSQTPPFFALTMYPWGGGLSSGPLSGVDWLWAHLRGGMPAQEATGAGGLCPLCFLTHIGGGGAGRGRDGGDGPGP